jgi:hypothetical protein
VADELVPPSRAALRDALSLSDEILRNIELGEIPLVRIALKTSRLARLLNDVEFQQIMVYEASGYPSTPTGVEPEVYRLAVFARREHEKKDETTGAVSKAIFTTPIEELEHDVASAGSALAAARDPDVSIASANPSQFVSAPSGNFFERNTIRANADNALRRLASRRALIYVLKASSQQPSHSPKRR